MVKVTFTVAPVYLRLTREGDICFHSHLCTLDGNIVHLRNINGLLARFIVREGGSVRRLKTSEAYRDRDYERTFQALPGPYSRGKPPRE